MRARNAAALGFTGLAALIIVAVQLGRLGGEWTAEDRRASSFLTGPNGTSALYETLRALGVDVVRERQRAYVDARNASPGEAAIALLGPALSPSSEDIRSLLGLNAGDDGVALLLAGVTSDPILRCFGFMVRPLLLDSVAIDRGRDAAEARGLTARALLVAVRPDSMRESAFATIGLPSCPGAIETRPDTLLASAAGAIAVRLSRPGGQDVIVVADERLFGNRALRGTGGAWAPAMLARQFHRVIFDEFHQGYGTSSSLGRAVVAWSLRSPAGWAAWQVVLAGVIALLAGAVRFGPTLPSTARRRRTSIEHVRALATALAAARGQEVATGLLVQGLRRRLSPRGRQPAGAWRQWLDQLAARATTARSREAIDRLRNLTTNRRDDAAVLLTANAVEDVWDSLRPQTATLSRR
jgi:Domain of unknown function (DUF4350)